MICATSGCLLVYIYGIFLTINLLVADPAGHTCNLLNYNIYVWLPYILINYGICIRIPADRYDTTYVSADIILI